MTEFLVIFIQKNVFNDLFADLGIILQGTRILDYEFDHRTWMHVRGCKLIYSSKFKTLNEKLNKLCCGEMILPYSRVEWLILQ